MSVSIRSGPIVRSLYKSLLRLSKELTTEVAKTGGTVESEGAKLYPSSVVADQHTTFSDILRREFRIRRDWTDEIDIDREVYDSALSTAVGS